MALPKIVVAAAEELAEFDRQFQAPAEEAVSEQTEQTPADPPAPEPAPALESTPEPTDPPEPLAGEDKWEHKYRRLQGKYDAEVPRLHQQVKELTSAMQHAQSLIEQAKQAPPPPPPTSTPSEPERYVSDEDITNYGEDFVDIQRRIALDATRELRKQLDELKAQMAQQSTQVQSVSFEARLHQTVPDFDAVNADPEWVAWLNEVDPLIRGPRRMVAQAAFERGDAEAIKSYVDLFKQGRQPPAPKTDNRTQELARQVQPSRASAAPPTATVKHYSAADVDTIFKKMTLLAQQGRLDEVKRLDAEISAAFSEGRVTA